MSEKTRILILAANPTDTARILVGNERDRILCFLEKSKLEHLFDVRSYSALRGIELQEKIRSFRPNIIHFSGHGEYDGLIFTDDIGEKSHLITKDTLAGFFERCKPYLKAVVLNACYSANQADAIVKQVPFLIGMNAAIDDKAATVFSEGFYTYIFNNTVLDIKNAYEDAKVQMRSAHFSEKEIAKFVLEQPPFTPNCKQDIFVCFAEKDKSWAEVFVENLQKELKKQLCPDGNLVIFASSCLDNIESSAVVLLITSNEFLQEHRLNLACFASMAQRRMPIYLVQIKTHEIPLELLGLERRKFWEDDERYSCITVLGKEYDERLKKFILELKNKLIKIPPPIEKWGIMFSLFSIVVIFVLLMRIFVSLPPSFFGVQKSKPEQASEIIDNRYEIIANGAEIKDLRTNLIWQRCQVGMTWNGTTCTGSAEGFTFDEAKKQTGNGWRLPTIRELSTLIYCSSGKMRETEDVGDGGIPVEGLCGEDYMRPTINVKAFPNTPSDLVWSNSPYVANSSYVWFVSFYIGNTSYYLRNVTYTVRLVR